MLGAWGCTARPDFQNGSPDLSRGVQILPSQVSHELLSDGYGL